MSSTGWNRPFCSSWRDILLFPVFPSRLTAILLIIAPLTSGCRTVSFVVVQRSTLNSAVVIAATFRCYQLTYVKTGWGRLAVVWLAIAEARLRRASASNIIIRDRSEEGEWSKQVPPISILGHAKWQITPLCLGKLYVLFTGTPTLLWDRS